MSIHTAQISWRRQGSSFLDGRYSRVHQWTFDGGAVVPASSSPHVVKLPFADPACVDPEEAYVAALSSCHMLFFLSIAAQNGFVVDQYTDDAEGRMAPNEGGQTVIVSVTLHANVMFSGPKTPMDEDVQRLHHQAHASCFLANSVKTDVRVAGSWTHAA